MPTFDFLPISQYYLNCMYIEINPTIKISQNIADTKWISEAYPIINSGVKPEAWKMRLLENKKGKSIALD